MLKPKFARIPVEILADKDLQDRDVRVYGVMSSFAYWGSAVSISAKEIAGHCGCSRMSVVRSLERLAAKEYITPAKQNGQGKRPFFVLTSKIFGQRQGKEDVIVRSRHGSRYVSMDNASHGLPPREEAV